MKHLFFLLIIINIISFSQSKIKSVTEPCNGVTTVTYEGKTYNTVAIGDQCWLKENLDAGTMIPSTQDATDNGVIEKYCYDDDPDNCVTYGGLYQWTEAMDYDTLAGSQGICPPGWHIPTKQEFESLKAAVGGDGNALLAVGQGGGTNTSGFSALLGGRRGLPSFLLLGTRCFIWGSADTLSKTAVMELNSFDNTIYLTFRGWALGFSVRCIKDNNTTAVGDNQNLISEYSLYQNYPNPFNPTTTISFSIPGEVKVNLAVFDLLGREIETLVNDNLSAGKYEVEFNAGDLSSGIYFYRITAGSYTNVKKLQILK